MNLKEDKEKRASKNRWPETAVIMGFAIALSLAFIWLFSYAFKYYIFPNHFRQGGDFESFFNRGPYHVFMIFAFCLVSLGLIILAYKLTTSVIIYILRQFLRKKNVTNREIFISNVISISFIILGVYCLYHVYSSNQIFYASRSGDIKLVSALLGKNPRLVCLRNKNGDTPLHIAAYAGHPKMIVILLENGANINEKNMEGNTALHEAILYRQKETVELLTARGARLSERNKSNYTPLSWALKYGYLDIADLLRQHGAKE